ncbi:hypothetical protein E4U55_007794 [Claviceps digitariae]|nr:hypothetical protein E4U55_007794 [Claviceps digitariae]
MHRASFTLDGFPFGRCPTSERTGVNAKWGESGATANPLRNPTNMGVDTCQVRLANSSHDASWEKKARKDPRSLKDLIEIALS